MNINISQIRNNLCELVNNSIKFEDINANFRNNPFLENILNYNSDTIQRVATVAVSFLNLYSPTALIVNTSLSSIKAYQTVQELKQAFITRQWKTCGKQLSYLAFIVTSLALSFLRPRLNLLISHSLHLAHQIYQLGHQLKSKEYLEGGKTGIKATFTAVYLASILITSSEILLISIVSQIIFECAQSVQEFNQGKRLEGITHLLLSGIRSYQSKALVQTCHRNWFGKQVTQEILEKLYTNSDEIIENQLIDNYYSSYLKNLEIKKVYFKHKFFSNLSFKNCKFDQVELIKCKFSNVKFNNCFFNQTTAIKSVFNQTFFLESQLDNSVFYASTLINTVFSQCDLSYACFNDSIFSQVTLNACQLVGTNFFSAKIFRSTLKNSDLTDCLLLSTKNKFQISHCTPHRMTKPVIALAWNFKDAGGFASLTDIALKDCQSIPLKFDYEPSDINITSLHAEVQHHLDQIRQERLSPTLSIADEILKRTSKESEIARIQAKSKEILSCANGLVLPGGKDIEVEFYDLNPSLGINKDCFTYTAVEKYDNYCRSIFEFTLIQEAKNKKIPTIGICRGSQIVNVYQGGTLTNHVDNHFGKNHDLHIAENLPNQPRQIIQSILKINRIWGLSMHHQACEKIGQGLTVVLKADDVPEALVTDDGNFILTQFHPEFYYALKKSLFSSKTKNKIIALKGAEKYAFFKKQFFSSEIANNRNFFTYLIDKVHQKHLNELIS